MGRLQINKVLYKGENYHYESPALAGGLNIIEGKNGNGKSTFMNLIYFGLSGKVDEFIKDSTHAHAEITKDSNNSVTLDVTLNNSKYSFIRFIDSNDITVVPEEGVARAFPINRSKNEKEIFSDWILDKLEIKPVEVFQGLTSSKINFRDLMRLIYHNQELNPNKIYKPAELENFISDSELIRKIIFELLIGKSYSDYYSTLAKFKEVEKQRNVAKAVLEEYTTFNKKKSDEDDLNIIFLKKAKEEKEDQLNKLYLYRESIKDNQVPKGKFYYQINEIKSQILSAELLISDTNREYNEVANELAKLKRLKENVILEVTQITKIIHSHEKLSLFSADTCPYCLRGVNREKGHCVCGKEVDEEQYERFFYSSDEYSSILRSKQKSIETINIAITACQEQVTTTTNEIEAQNDKIKNLQETLTTWVDNYDFRINSQELKEADDTILSIRTEINNLNQKIDIEEKRERLQQRFNSINSAYEGLRAQVKTLEGQANTDIRGKVDQFNTTYNELMLSTLKKCKSAAIGYDDYMPIIDGGTYKEASASVTIRLMYFFTLLSLSLANDDVKFPRFLLIDTPETAGVDEENLKNAIAQVATITKKNKKDDYQIIFTTGIKKYPQSFDNTVKIKLSDDQLLLNPVEKKE